MGFDGVGVDTFPRVFHKSTKQDKGKKLALGVFRSPLPINIENAKVNPLHVIFDLKWVLVAKDYFRINHLLPPPFNLIWGHTLLSKSIVPMLVLKEFLFMCLE